MGEKKKRRYVSQTDVPRVTLEQALRVPNTIAENYAKEPTRPIDVAAALEMSPTSGAFRDLCGAAIGYGLTDGGPNASEIALTPLGLRIVAPLQEGDDHQALREAALIPTVLKRFLEKYDGSPLPMGRIGLNVLESLDVPTAATERVLSLILENATYVGFLKPIKDKTYVDLGGAELGSGPVSAPSPDPSLQVDAGEIEQAGSGSEPLPVEAEHVRDTSVTPPPSSVARNRRVFVSHGKSKRVVDQLKELLTFGDFEPVVSVERESVSKPVPQKVLDDMRTCAAGIIHVRPEERVLEPSGSEKTILNQNVLIEIGAAMALYGDNFILLVEDGAALPSNLQGLYEVRYVGDELGYEATMKTLKALNEFKSSNEG